MLMSAFEVKSYLYMAMSKFSKLMANEMRISEDIFKIPLNFDEPINPESKGSIREFFIPGYYLISVFYTAAIIVTHYIIVEMNGGVFQRSIVAGISAQDILSSNIIFLFIVQIFQITALISSAYFIMNIHTTGPFFIFISTIFSQGLCVYRNGYIVF